MTSQPEYILEEKLVAQLQELGHKKVIIKNEEDLIKNLKIQLEIHNKKTFSEKEFEKILNHLAKGNVFEKAKILRDKFQYLKDDGSPEWIEFINQDHWCQNQFQVTHQVTQGGDYKNRYDVTLLINGLPLVQIELKRRGLEMKEAFNQVNRYQKHSFGSGKGLFNYVQLFIISNGVNTKYYSNNSYQSFKQTFFWSDEENNNIKQLDDFTQAFLEPCQVAKMITKYIVLNQTYKILMVLRPYQYYAVERIVDKVRNTNNNGFIWHTTGSGKTLTSFKASQIIKEIPEVEKVVFVVDRKDLDYQTQKEFDAFEKGSVDATENTKHLVKQLSDNTKLIVTTLQKLNTAITKEKHGNKINQLRNKKVVFIFDECHRSQFGETHQNIKKYFQKAQMIGFTGTPISEVNSIGRVEGQPATTNRLFGDCLHKYVITDAIKDENVLRFSVEYVGRYKEKEGSNTHIDIDVEDIDTKELLESESRLNKITDYIISQYNRKTHDKTFNAMFCVSGIEVLQKYYDLFYQKKQEGKHQLRVATIYSYGVNEDDKSANGIIEEEILFGIENEVKNILGSRDLHSRDALEKYIGHYNDMFSTNFTTRDSQSFYNYYNDVAKRVRSKELDLILVVNMFLTGFDSPQLNTLFVDKNLKYHGLIQALSRTNRILNEKKSHGNIVCFRNLKSATDDAVTLFSNKEAVQEIIIHPIENYIDSFNDALNKLKSITPTYQSVDDLISEQQEFEFIKAFRDLMRILNVLKSFSDFSFEKLELTEWDFDGYKSKYLDIWQKYKHQPKEKVSVLDDVDFELELIHKDEINVSYILTLLTQLKEKNLKGDKLTQKQKEISDLIAGNVQLRSKKELIEKFILENLPHISDPELVKEHFDNFWNNEREKAFEIIAKEENLNKEQFQNTISEYLFSEKTPKISEVLQLLEFKPKLTDRGTIARRILGKIQDFVQTFMDGIE